MISVLFRLFLVICLLGFQQAGAHYHLATSHDHDGLSHQHQLTGHSHHSRGDHHDDVFSSLSSVQDSFDLHGQLHQAHDLLTIELQMPANAAKSQSPDDPADQTVVIAAHGLPAQFASSASTPIAAMIAGLPWLSIFPNINPLRGPPVLV